MVEIKKIKITKKSYEFEIKKRYYYSKRYKIKEKTPIEKIKEVLSKIVKPKKTEKTPQQTMAEPTQGGINPLILGVAVILAMAAVTGVWFYLTVFAYMVETPLQNESFKPYINISILEKDIATIGDIHSENYVAYVTTYLQHAGIKNASVKLSIYNERLQSEIFMLKSEREDAETQTYPKFVGGLRKRLGEKGLLLNEIDFEQLESIPKGAVVIVPTGTVPQELLGVNSNIKIKKLLERGVVVIYIGKAFTKGMLTGTGATVPTSQSVLTASGFSFKENVPLQVGYGFHVSQPLYKAEGSMGSSSSLDLSATNRMEYGFLSIVKLGDGAFVFVPQTLDSAWDDANLAAEDVARIITETPWATLTEEPTIYQFNTTTNMTSEKIDFFSDEFKNPPKSAKLEITAYTTENEKKEWFETTEIKKKNTGDLYIDGGFLVAPTDISGKKIRMNAKPRGNSSEERFLALVFTKGGEEIGAREQIQGSRNVQTESTFDVDVHLDTGDYIVHLVDDENKEYAKCYMKVASVDIIYDGMSNGKYTFFIKKGGALIKMKKVDVKVDNGKYGSESFSDVSNITIDINKYTNGEGFQPRKEPYVFSFKIGELVKTIPISVTKSKTIVEEPMFQASVLLSVVILGVGFYFARQEKVIYLIDIPDFPPLAHTKIALQPETVISIFEKVNEDYKWSYGPLTVTEIKNGFRKIFNKGRPIYISDYNTEFVLRELMRYGDVKECLDYYGPVIWEKKAGYNIKYLALLRRMRDICVNNAVPFTQLGEAKDSDSEITCMGQQMYVHIYNSDDAERLKDIAKRALKTIKLGITILLFKDANEKKEFLAILASPNPAFLSLKLENEAKSFLLLTTDEFEKMIRELKEI